ncbi:hypothetical protein MRX96_054589 [Rhipicephalus microplus]
MTAHADPQSRCHRGSSVYRGGLKAVTVSLNYLVRGEPPQPTAGRPGVRRGPGHVAHATEEQKREIRLRSVGDNGQRECWWWLRPQKSVPRIPFLPNEGKKDGDTFYLRVVHQLRGNARLE